MSLRPASLAVIGPHGSGRTHALREWAAEVDRTLRVAPTWLTSANLVSALEATSEDVSYVADDVHLLSEAHLQLLVDTAASRPVAISALTWPSLPGIERLVEAIERNGDAAHLGPRTTAQVGELLDVGVTGQVNPHLPPSTIVEITGGSIALITDVVKHRWDGAADTMPTPLADAIMRRVRRQPDAVISVLQITSSGVPLPLAIEIIETRDGINDLERQVRCSGLTDLDTLAPVAREAVRGDLTKAERAKYALLIEPVLSRLGATTRARLVSDGAFHPNTAAPTTRVATERAAAAFRLGDPTTLAQVASLPDTSEPSTAILAFGIDMRALRSDRAAQRHLGGPSASSLVSLARAFAGQTSTEIHAPNDVEAEIWQSVCNAIDAFATGDHHRSLDLISRAADDAAKCDLATPAGITPHFVGAALAIGSGDPAAAIALLDPALTQGVGGPGEFRSHALLRAYAAMQTGDYSSALDFVRIGEDDTWTHRDRILLAGIDAGIARRSGDTARLRSTWGRVAPLLVRQSVSWVLCDPLIELLAAGARIGDYQRTQPLQRQLLDQLTGLPPAGPGPACANWVDLQVALATEDWAQVSKADGTFTPSDARSQARVAARHAWTLVAQRKSDADTVRAAASALAEVSDAWEASRLLGQAALDQSDPAIARSLLEEARLLVTEPVAASDGLVSAGLSEREAEVARLVAQGQAYKAIGSQLFISPKTVEHHVAKIRQRLGASSRAELLAMIREIA